MKSLTIVFEIHDEESFKPLMEDIKDLMFLDADINKVVAMGQGNEITRIELIEQAIEKLGTWEAADCVQEILGMNSNEEDFYDKGLKLIEDWYD